MTSESPIYHNRLVAEPLSADEVKLLARGHGGMIKFVVDVRLKKLAAGAEWHSECRDLLVENGSAPDDCWGAKIYPDSGEIVYQSQINKEKPGHNTVEIQNGKIRDEISALAGKIFGI